MTPATEADTPPVPKRPRTCNVTDKGRTVSDKARAMSDSSDFNPKHGPTGRPVTRRAGFLASSVASLVPTPATRPARQSGTSSLPASSSDYPAPSSHSSPPGTVDLDTTALSPEVFFDESSVEGTGRSEGRTRSRERPPPEGRRRGESISDTAPGSLSVIGSFADSETGARDSREENVADPLIGLVLAERYRIVEFIGRGGMGIVYRVEHVSIGKSLAMKLLAGELSTNKEVVRRFKQEAMTVSKLSCPYTVQVFDYGHWQHLTFLVMELVEGLDLSRTLRRHGPIPFARLGRWMVQVCTSLIEAHSKGIVHRDIKPENIMLSIDESGIETAKVLDFGLAKLRESPELNEVTLQGTVIGTPYYMSPEQILGEDIDGRSDIYSLGAVMYRTLTGCFPYSATTPMAMFTKHLTQPPPDIEARHPDLDIPKGISDAVLRCMAKKREDRFQSIDELRDLLVSELQSLGVLSTDTLFAVRSNDVEAERRPLRRATDEPIATRKELEAYEAQLRRNRYGVWALAGVLVLGALGGSGWFAFRPQPNFRGVELEPNDNAGTANELPIGESIRGTIGKRMEERTGDHDVYRVTIPGNGAQNIALQLEPLPNFGLCASLYRVGYQQSTAQYCSGPVGGQALAIPQIRVDAGDYLVVVHQDRSPPPGSKLAPPIHENISDRYRLSLTMRTETGADIEPNDGLEGPQMLHFGDELTGALGFTEDVDVFCSTKSGVRWTLEDGSRRFGSVLEVTPFVDGSPLPLARVHGSKTQPHSSRPRIAADVNGPWRSTDCTAEKCCIQLRLTRDPWSDTDATGPLPDETRYRVKLESVN